MAESTKGRLILKTVPGGTIEKKVVAYLCSLSKKSNQDKVTVLVRKAPVVLSKSISEKSGTIIVAELQRLGATALFEPTPLAIGKSLPSVSHTISDKITPPQTEDTKLLTSPHNKPAWGKRDKVRPILLGLLLLCVAGYGLFFTSNNLLSDAAHRLLSHPHNGHGSSNLTTSLFAATNMGGTVAQFDLRHSPYVDQRIVNAMSEAFKEYVRLFKIKGAQGRGLRAEVTFTIDQVDNERYHVEYDVALGKLQKNYDVVLSTGDNGLTEALRSFSGILQTFSNDFKKYITPSRSIKKITSEHTDNIERLISGYNSRDLFAALMVVENDISGKELDPLLLLKVSEIFAWLSIFKDIGGNENLANAMGVQSLSNYFIAGLFYDDDEKTPRYYGALLSLALHYENEALKTLATVHEDDKKREVVLSAYIKYDTSRLKELAHQNGMNKIVVKYLLARVYQQSKQYELAEEELLKVLRDYPDFLAGKEYLSKIGSVGVSGRVTNEMLHDTIENDLHFIGTLFYTDWVAKDNDLQMRAAKEVDEDKVLAKWVDIHNRIIDNSQRFKGAGTVLTPELTKAYLKENLLNGLYFYFRFEAKRLARLSKASEIFDIAEKNYPDSDTVKGMKIQILYEYEQYQAVKDYVKTINIQSVGAFALRNMLYVHKGWKDWRKWPKIVNTLNKYREQETPDSRGSYHLFYYYNEFYYKPVAFDYLKRLHALNTYKNYAYILLAKYGGGEKYIAEGQELLKNHYGFQIRAAWWYRNSKEFGKAIHHFQKAMKLSPQESDAYRYIGDIYKKQKRYDEAIDIWNKYLEYDDRTLAAVNIKNRIGRVYLETGQYEKAYEVFDDAKESYQAGALQGFGHASEKLGKTLQAEEYFKKAAKRYQNGDAPVDLALFYFRQGNEETGLGILKEYERYNHPTYFLDEVVDYFEERGNPRKAIHIAREVNKKRNDPYFLAHLAERYSRKGFHGIAAEIYKEIANDDRLPHRDHTIYYIVKFFDSKIKEKPDSREEIFNEAHSMLEDDINYTFTFGTRLILRGYYDEAYKVFEQDNRRVDSVVKNEKYATLLMMAVSWRGGSQNPEHKRHLLEELEMHDIGEWYDSVVRYLLSDYAEDAIMSKADDINKVCEIHYFTGLLKSSEDKRDDAMKHLLISLETKASNNVEYRYAYERLKILTES